MKHHIIKYAAALTLTLMVVACSNSSEEGFQTNGDDGALRFVIGNGMQTRATDTQFEVGDAIGVFCSTQADGALLSSGNYADNARYIYSSGSFINSGAGVELPKDADHDVTYYGVYPYTQEASSQFTFAVNANQSSYEGYTTSDLCMARSTAGPTENPVALKFNHLLSRVLIDASGVEGLYAGNYSIELLGYRYAVTVDVQQQSVTTLGNKGTAPSIKVCENGTNHFKAIMVPQTLSSSAVVGTVIIGQQRKSILLNKDVELTSGTSVELKLVKKSGEYYFEYSGTGNSSGSSIPDDSEANPNPEVSDPNAAIPNIQYVSEVVGNDVIIRIDMTGIQNPVTKEWIKLFGTMNPEQNIWISVDGKPKGFTVYNNDNSGENNIKTDVIFTVDNSGSMNQEADAVARDIISWANLLSSSGLDVRFACVGYSVSGTINGGIDFTTADALSSYLNRTTGTSRTYGFAGSNATALQSAATPYRVSDECGAMAIRYANANLNFRSGANRIYVNFTDEYNQPAGHQEYSVEFFNSQTNWGTAQGTVHTVYSGSSDTYKLYWNEEPWKISNYTGGTTFMTNSSFTGVNLANLPVTSALQNSYVIRFHNIAHLVGDGKTHTIKITIRSHDGQVRAERTFLVTFVL